VSAYALLSLSAQVCLAAEECGHLDFDSRVDMWWNSESFHCGSGPRGTVHFHDIFIKVCGAGCMNQHPGAGLRSHLREILVGCTQRVYLQA
jgi:hypothetical protein